VRDREKRELLVIEKNLLAESPELAALFGPLAHPGRRERNDRSARWFLIGLLVLGLLLEDTPVILAAYALLSVSVVRWIVRSTGAGPRRRWPP
jgi:hypothetical protein